MPVQVQPMTRRSQKMPPHSTAAERVLLAGVLKDADDVLPALAVMGFTSGDLFHYPHRLVYETTLDLWNRFHDPDPLDVFRHLQRRDLLPELGPSPVRWLIDLTHTPPCFPNMERWQVEGSEFPEVSLYVAAPLAAARLIQWLGQRRSAVHAAASLLRDALDGHLCPDDPRLELLQTRAAA